MVTLEEAMAIASHRLPEEPGDALTSWQAMRPRPEPEPRPVRVDIDWASIIRNSLRGERAHVLEVVGQALGQYGDGLLGEVETMIAAAANQLRAEILAELANQVDHLRAELAAQSDHFQAEFTAHGARLRSESEEAIAAKKARGRKARGTPCDGFVPLGTANGDAHGPQ
jgi:hypothetical protein